MPDPQLPQAALRLVVPGRDEPDDRDPGLRQATERVAVQATQVGGEQDRARLPRGGGGEQVGQVHAATDDDHPQVAPLEGADELRLPDGVRDGGEDGNGH